MASEGSKKHSSGTVPRLTRHPDEPTRGPRLAGMMLLTYFGLGSWIVPFARYLPTDPSKGGLGFDAGDVSLIYATVPLAGMITPLLVAPLADRFFSAERLYSFLHFIMACSLTLVGWWCSQPDAVNHPWPLFCFMLLYTLALMPSLTLSNVIAMRNLSNPSASFGRIRLVGTMGWIISGFVISWLVLPVSPQPLFVSAATSFVLSIYSFYLPKTPPMGHGRGLRDLIGISALSMFKDRAFVAFAIATLIGNMLNQFYVLNSNRYLNENGIPRTEAVLTIAQWCEMICLALVPTVVRKFGLRIVLLSGLVAWFLRNVALAFGPVWVAVAVAIPLHGLSYTFFTIVGALFVDRDAPPHLRASAQALVTFLSSGPAVIAGYWLTSVTGQHYMRSDPIDWVGIWMVPTIGILVAVILFALLFREPEAPSSSEVAE